MKAVSIKMQQWIMRIPLVNVATLFICIYNLHAVPIRMKNELKVVAFLLGYSVPTAIVYSFLYRCVSEWVPSVAPILYTFGIYLIPLVMSYGLIQFQQKYIFASQKKKEGKPQ